MNHFSEQLKELRQEQNLSMQTLADKAKVSKSMISKIENNDVQPTLDVAARLAKALGKTLSEMLHATQIVRTALLRRNKQAVWEDPKLHIKRRNISPVFEGLKIEWLYVELPPKVGVKNLPAASKECEKYVLVTKGELIIKINQEIFQLEKGDSMYFDASHTHELSNPSRKITEYYIVIKHP